MTCFLKIFHLLFIFITVTINYSFAETSVDEFENWLISYKKFASEKGISQETLKVAFQDVKFLDQVIRYDRKQPEFFEDTITYINKRATLGRARNARENGRCISRLRS